MKKIFKLIFAVLILFFTPNFVNADWTTINTSNLNIWAWTATPIWIWQSTNNWNVVRQEPKPVWNWSLWWGSNYDMTSENFTISISEIMRFWRPSLNWNNLTDKAESLFWEIINCFAWNNFFFFYFFI